MMETEADEQQWVFQNLKRRSKMNIKRSPSSTSDDGATENSISFTLLTTRRLGTFLDQDIKDGFLQSGSLHRLFEYIVTTI